MKMTSLPFLTFLSSVEADGTLKEPFVEGFFGSLAPPFVRLARAAVAAKPETCYGSVADRVAYPSCHPVFACAFVSLPFALKSAMVNIPGEKTEKSEK